MRGNKVIYWGGEKKAHFGKKIRFSLIGKKKQKQRGVHTSNVHWYTFSHTHIYIVPKGKKPFMECYQPALIKGWHSNFILFLKIGFSWVTLSYSQEPTAHVTTLLSAAWCPSPWKGSTVPEKASFWMGWMISIWAGGQGRAAGIALK